MLAIALIAWMILFPSASWAEPPGAQIFRENDSVRVTLFTFPPGTGTGQHSGIEAELGIVLSGQVTTLGPKGRDTIPPGGTFWFPGLTPHDIRNESGRTAQVWSILLKRGE